MVSMLFLGTPKFRKSRFLWLSPGPPSAPELTFAHAAMKDFISNPPFLCGAALISDRPLLSRNLVLSDTVFLYRTLCRTQHKKNRHWRTPFCGLFASPCWPSYSVMCSTLSTVEKWLAQHHSCVRANFFQARTTVDVALSSCEGSDKHNHIGKLVIPPRMCVNNDIRNS